jgi:hypothetical protein
VTCSHKQVQWIPGETEFHETQVGEISMKFNEIFHKLFLQFDETLTECFLMEKKFHEIFHEIS